jgi:RecB family exonuclease
MKISPPMPQNIPISNELYSTYGWHPNMASDKILRITKSSYTTFLTCEQQYFIKYVLGVKEPQNDNMIRGTNVHDAYEYILAKELDIEKATQLKSNGFEPLKEYFNSLIPPSQIKKGWNDEYAKPTGEDYVLQEREHLGRLMDAEARRFMVSDPKAFKPVGNEFGVDAIVELEVRDTKVKVHLSGFIDRMFMDNDGNYHVHELKTGIWKDTKTKYDSMAKEMAFYVYLLRKAPQLCDFGGINVSYWGWDHTNGHQDEPSEIYRFIEPVRADVIKEMISELKAIVSAHLRYDGGVNGKMFATKPSGSEKYFCKPWCSVKGFCPLYERHMMPTEMRERAERG